jgi:hypothetical protein
VRKSLALFLCLIFAPYVSADVKVSGEATYKPHDPIVLKASEASSAKAQFLWDISEGAQFVEAGGTLYVWAPPGTYKVRLTSIDFDSKKIERASFTFTVSGKAPVPPGPNPPGPDPPGPKPTPAPIQRPGLHVLILYDAEDTQLPKGQRNILEGKQVRDWLEANTVQDPDIPSWKTYWIAPHKTDVLKMPKVWQDAFNRPHASIPWVIISNGTTGFEGPLPNSPAEFIALAQKYVGTKRVHHPKPLKKAG